MKIIRLLINPVPISDQMQKLLHIPCTLLFLFSAYYYFYHILCVPLWAAAAAVAVLGAAAAKLRSCAVILRNPPVAHIVSLLAVVLLLPKPSYFNEILNDLQIITAGLSSILFYTFLADYCFGLLKKRNNGESHPELFGKSLLICFSFFFTVLFFLTSESFLSNRDQLHYSFQDFAPQFAFWTVSFSVISALLFCSFSRTFARILSCIFTGLLLCVYCQYMFMNQDLPIIGVEDIDWASLKTACAVNFIVLLLIFAVPFAAVPLARTLRKTEPTPIPKFNCIISGVLLGTQAVTLIILFASTPFSPSLINMQSLSGTEQFTLSQKRNAVTLILDAMDQKFFEAKYEEQPADFQCLKDFTCYTNTAMVYDSTYLSIPAMLTCAQAYPESAVQNWYKQICTDKPAQEFFSRLHDNQYIVNAFGDFSYDYDYSYFSGFFDNLSPIRKEDVQIDKSLLNEMILKMVKYRALPLALKRYFPPGDMFGNEAVRLKNGCIFDNKEFLDQALLSTAESSKNYFIVQHLNGAHQHGSGTFEEKLQWCIEIMNQYIAQMQEAGVYDDALIIITADHGEHAQPDNMPILYLKRPHETHDAIQFSSAPISLSDYTATVLDSLGLTQSGDTEMFGTPVYHIPESEPRERTVFQRKPFSNEDSIPRNVKGYHQFYGMLFGYTYTGTKQDLAAHEMNDMPDIILETPGFR